MSFFSDAAVNPPLKEVATDEATSTNGQQKRFDRLHYARNA